jgi:hypothetical protein
MQNTIRLEAEGPNNIRRLRNYNNDNKLSLSPEL